MEFFAGANTKDGFVSIFEEAFSGAERLYVIKGSSGCGKSTFMRRIAVTAREKGFQPRLVFCSGDPDSLDGVIVPELGFAVADGTPPHVIEPKYPLVRESILNFCEFLSEKKLAPHREEVVSLTAEKSVHYSAAYRLINAACAFLHTARDSALPYLDSAGIRARAENTLKKYAGAYNGKTERLFASGFTPKGLCVKPAFDGVKKIFFVGNRYGEGELFIGALARAARELKADHAVSLCGVDKAKTDSVFFGCSGALFTLLETPPCAGAEARKISLSKFADTASLAALKNRLRLLAGLSDSAFAEAQKELASAGDIHRKIENVYSPALDLSAVNEFTQSFIKRVFA